MQKAVVGMGKAWIKGDVGTVKLVKPCSIFLVTVPMWFFFCGSYLLFVLFFCHTAMSVSCSFVVTCLERADLLAFLYVMFSCVFVTFPYGVLVQVRYLIAYIPDLCLLSYFVLCQRNCLHGCKSLCAKCMLHRPLFAK